MGLATGVQGRAATWSLHNGCHLANMPPLPEHPSQVSGGSCMDPCYDALVGATTPPDGLQQHAEVRRAGGRSWFVVNVLLPVDPPKIFGDSSDG